MYGMEESCVKVYITPHFLEGHILIMVMGKHVYSTNEYNFIHSNCFGRSNSIYERVNKDHKDLLQSISPINMHVNESGHLSWTGLRFTKKKVRFPTCIYLKHKNSRRRPLYDKLQLNSRQQDIMAYSTKLFTQE